LLEDKVLAKRDGKEDTKEAARKGKSNKLAEILIRKLAQETQTIHGRYGGDEENTKTTSGYSTKIRK
jgi:hypothetical protein